MQSYTGAIAIRIAEVLDGALVWDRLGGVTSLRWFPMFNDRRRHIPGRDTQILFYNEDPEFANFGPKPGMHPHLVPGRSIYYRQLLARSSR